jgi:hypothetical protein
MNIKDKAILLTVVTVPLVAAIAEWKKTKTCKAYNSGFATVCHDSLYLDSQSNHVKVSVCRDTLLEAK